MRYTSRKHEKKKKLGKVTFFFFLVDLPVTVNIKALDIQCHGGKQGCGIRVAESESKAILDGVGVSRNGPTAKESELESVKIEELKSKAGVGRSVKF